MNEKWFLGQMRMVDSKIRWETKSEKFSVWLEVDQQIISVSYLVDENVSEVLIQPLLYVGCIV